MTYLFRADTENYSSFIQDYPEGEESIMGRAMNRMWQPFDDDYKPVKLMLTASYTGKKNYKFDFGSSLQPFLVLSEFTLTSLADIFEPRGQILPVITESKRKKFFGYYPTNPLKGCLDLQKSEYREYPKGLVISKPVLIANKITDEYFFSIEEDISRVFVTNKFKQRVEEAGLLGFDFTRQIETS